MVVLISARDEPAERWCVAKCRKACGCKAVIFVLLIRFIASHIVFLEICPKKMFLKGNK
jgi:hypothetical protein